MKPLLIFKMFSLSVPGLFLIMNTLSLPLKAQLSFEHSIQQVAHAGVLYAGLENRIMVSGAGVDGACAFSSSAGSQVQGVPGGLVIRPVIPGGMDTLRVIKNGSELGSHVFRVLPPADPLPQLAFSPDTSMPLARILNNPFLSVWHPDGKTASGMRIVSFHCTVRKSSSDVFYFTSTGNRLSSEMLGAIQTLRPNAVIEFDQIRVKLETEQHAKFLTPLKVVVK